VLLVLDRRRPAASSLAERVVIENRRLVHEFASAAPVAPPGA
jgi:hypothetical protein